MDFQDTVGAVAFYELGSVAAGVSRSVLLTWRTEVKVLLIRDAVRRQWRHIIETSRSGGRSSSVWCRMLGCVKFSQSFYGMQCLR